VTRFLWTLWIVLVTGFAPSLAAAELTVIYDSGDTRPLAPYLKVFETQGPEPARTPSPKPSTLGAADLAQLLPIRSPGLTPGPVQRQAVSRPFTRPFFLIGSDPLSRDWLATHRDRLDEIGAVGMLVEAETVDDLGAVAELANGLPILPASASDIARALGLAHYPVLITKHGLEQ
jgi:integrating conjugative element protein (TIGR03765 family)